MNHEFIFKITYGDHFCGIDKDGKFQHSEGCDLNKAAQIFWDHVEELSFKSVLKDAISVISFYAGEDPAIKHGEILEDAGEKARAWLDRFDKTISF